MSSFYGIFYRDGRSVSQEEAQKMQQTFDWWRPDESDFVIQDNILIGQATLYNTPESKYEHLPLQKANYILAMDARIDNREELAKELELPNKPLQEIGDSEFILASYRKWGKECADKLLGDFAFVIWDEAKQELFCARDFIGVKTLYYTILNNNIIFSTDLKGLVKTSYIKPNISDNAIANYIVNGMLMDNTLTFFQNIKKLPYAHTMTISKNKIKIQQYWYPNKIKQKTFSTLKELTQTTLELLEKVVQNRIRSTYPISSHLSGGIDSSAIAVLASRQLPDKNKLIAFNWIAPEIKSKNNTQEYEWQNSIQIAKQENIDLNFINLTSNTIKTLILKKNILYDSTRLWYEYPIREKVQQQKSRVLLSGFGGDEFISHHGYAYLADAFINREYKRFYKLIQNKLYKSSKKLKYFLSIFYFKLFIPCMPSKLYCFFPKISCNKTDYNAISKKLHKLIKDEKKKKNYVFERNSVCTIHADLIRAFNEGHIQSRLESWHNTSYEYHMEYRYPLLDKRVIELALSIPGHYFFNNGYGRYFYRNTIHTLLPQNIIWGSFKQEPHRVNKLYSLYEELLEEFLTNKHPKRYINQKYLYEIYKTNKEKAMQYLSLYPLIIF